MLTREQVLAYVSSNPGATSKDIAKQFSITPAKAAVKFKQYFDGGYVTRKEVGRTLVKSPIYGYFVHSGIKPEMSKKERVAHSLASDKTTVSANDLTEMIQSLSTAIAKQIAAQVAVSLQESLPRELAGVVPPAPPEVPKLNLAALPAPSPVIAAKPRIGIVGLLPVQQVAIDEEFKDVFDLRYWKDESTSALKALGRSCELVIITKWAGHKYSEVLSSVGATWRFIGGGLSEVKSALTALYVES